MAFFKTSAKFDKTVRDIKDSVCEFIVRNQYEILTFTAVVGVFAVATVWEGVGEKLGYNKGYAQGAIDAMKVGIELNWYRPEVLGK